MTLPRFVDLRSNYEQVYNQGTDGSCGPHAITAVLDVLFERATGVAHRFDKQYIWDYCHLYQGRFGRDVGINFDSASQTLEKNGAMVNGEIITGFKLSRTKFPNDWNQVKHLLASGVPQVLVIRAGSAFMNGTENNGKPWRDHIWGTPQTILDFQYSHAVALIGYDEDAKMWLVENSWGTAWGDGGFFGISYEQMRYMHEEMWNISMLPIKIIPTEGYDMTVNYLHSAEAANFISKSTPALRELLVRKLNDDGVQGLIDECKKWGVSDKHMELLAGWPRLTVFNFKAENPSLNWNGFLWEQV